MPPTVRSINNETWKTLSETFQKLNRIVLHLDTKSCNNALTKTEIFAIPKHIKHLMPVPSNRFKSKSFALLDFVSFFLFKGLETK